MPKVKWSLVPRMLRRIWPHIVNCTPTLYPLNPRGNDFLKIKNFWKKVYIYDSSTVFSYRSVRVHLSVIQLGSQSIVRSRNSSACCSSLVRWWSAQEWWSKQGAAAPDSHFRRIIWTRIICGEEGSASRPMLSLVRWQVWGGSGKEGGSVMKLGEGGLWERSSIVGSGREALKGGQAFITLLGGSIESGRALNTLLGGSIESGGVEVGGDEGGGVEGGGRSVAEVDGSVDEKSGKDRWLDGGSGVSMLGGSIIWWQGGGRNRCGGRSVDIVLSGGVWLRGGSFDKVLGRSRVFIRRGGSLERKHEAWKPGDTGVVIVFIRRREGDGRWGWSRTMRDCCETWQAERQEMYRRRGLVTPMVRSVKWRRS